MNAEHGRSSTEVAHESAVTRVLSFDKGSGEEARDSDFGVAEEDVQVGLSDRQIAELWRRCEPGPGVRSACMSYGSAASFGVADDSIDDSPSDADYGISDEQLKWLVRRPAIECIDSQEVESVTWYLFRVRQSGEETFYMKRYSDFKTLDGKLREQKQVVVPELPPEGFFGIQQRFKIGDFAVRRLKGLQSYLEELVNQRPDIADIRALQEFFSTDPSSGYMRSPAQ